MFNPVEIENLFNKYIGNLADWAHDGLINVDLKLLYELGLLDNFDDINEDSDDLTQYFHVIESAEKVTLFNEQFIIWIEWQVSFENSTRIVMTPSGKFSTLT